MLALSFVKCELNLIEQKQLLKKVITKLNLSKVSGPKCITVVVLNKCEPNIS